MIVLWSFVLIWVLITLFEILSVIHLHRKKSINYKSITVRYRYGKEYKEFENVTNYVIDDFGNLTFYDTDNILHCAVANWKITKHSND